MPKQVTGWHGGVFSLTRHKNSRCRPSYFTYSVRARPTGVFNPKSDELGVVSEAEVQAQRLRHVDVRRRIEVKQEIKQDLSDEVLRPLFALCNLL